MKKIKAKKLSMEAFSPYGQYADLLNPSSFYVGPWEHAFFPDRFVFNYESNAATGICVSQVHKRPNIVDTAEFHRYTGEVLMPIDGDIVIDVCRPSGSDQPPYDEFEAFVIPAGTAVVLKTGVWHYAAYTCTAEKVNILTLLPERTYANDCVVVSIPEGERFEIEL